MEKAIADAVAEGNQRSVARQAEEAMLAGAENKEAAEKAKIELTTLMSTDIDLPS
jgi:hypothetical protein